MGVRSSPDAWNPQPPVPHLRLFPSRVAVFARHFTGKGTQARLIYGRRHEAARPQRFPLSLQGSNVRSLQAILGHLLWPLSGNPGCAVVAVRQTEVLVVRAVAAETTALGYILGALALGAEQATLGRVGRATTADAARHIARCIRYLAHEAPPWQTLCFVPCSQQCCELKLPAAVGEALRPRRSCARVAHRSLN